MNELSPNFPIGNSNLHCYLTTTERLGSRSPLNLRVISWAFSRLNSNRYWREFMVQGKTFTPFAPKPCTISKNTIKPMG